MNNKHVFELIIILSLISDMIVSLFIAMKLYSLRNGRQTWWMTYLAAIFLGIFLRGLFHMVAEGYGFKVMPVYTVGYGVSYWFGRICLTLPCWCFAVKLFTWKKDDKQ